MGRQDFLCLLINLDGSDARLETASRALRAADLEFTRLSAFDGRALDLSSFAAYDATAARRYMGRELVGGEIGCYMSHLAAAQAFLDTEADACLVLEDDIAPPPDLASVVRQTLDVLQAHDPAWRIVNLGNPSLKIATPVQIFGRANRPSTLCAAHYFPMTTGAILWSRTGAEEFVASKARIFAPVDNYLRHWITRVGGGYAFTPRIVPTTEAESEIAQTASRSRSRTRRHLLYGVRKQRRLLIDKWIAARARRKAQSR